jgi:23S rRNA (adenine2030-N6)-methyltransferase
VPLQPPPASRHGAVRNLFSYEMKSDYGRVADCTADAVKRFATGTYVVW